MQALACAMTSPHVGIVLRLSSAAIAVNMRELLMDTCEPLNALDPAVVALLRDALRLDTHTPAAALLPHLAADTNSQNMPESAAADAAALRALFLNENTTANPQITALIALQQHVAAQQLALETLTNLYTCADVPDLPETMDNEAEGMETLFFYVYFSIPVAFLLRTCFFFV